MYSEGGYRFLDKFVHTWCDKFSYKIQMCIVVVSAAYKKSGRPTKWLKASYYRISKAWVTFTEIAHQYRGKAYIIIYLFTSISLISFPLAPHDVLPSRVKCAQRVLHAAWTSPKRAAKKSYRSHQPCTCDNLSSLPIFLYKSICVRVHLFVVFSLPLGLWLLRQARTFSAIYVIVIKGGCTGENTPLPISACFVVTREVICLFSLEKLRILFQNKMRLWY